MRCKILLLTIAICFFNFSNAQKNTKLWSDRSAVVWEENFPLGNGRLGAMPDGGISAENIVLNEITLWSGGPQVSDDPEAIKYLPKIRELLLSDKNDEAEALMYKTFISKGAGSGNGEGANVPYGSYQVLGNLHLNYGLPNEAKNYRRELDIRNAVATTSFIIDGIKYKREYLTDFINDVIFIKLTASKPGKISFTATLDRPERYETTTNGEELQMRGQLNNGTDGNGMKYDVIMRVIPEDGEMVAKNKYLELKHANSALIIISAATNFKNAYFEKQVSALLDSAAIRDYDKTKQAHSNYYQKMFDRSAVYFGTNQRAESLPTLERLKLFASNKNDPGLAALYFQYGRYLAISSTRPGLLPPNLQGLWANTIQTPWNGDYHLDVNIQMNHWPLEVTNLPMLNQPYLELVKSLVEPGKKTAKTYYNGKGWVAHVITNIWGYTSPGEHPSWGATNSGSGWLSAMLWRHYAFTENKEYLEEIYPIIKGSAEFYNSTLVNYPSKNWLVTAPSNSPENAFYLPNGKTAHVTIAPTVDNQIIRALFRNVINASIILDVDEPLREELKTRITKIPGNKIGSDGRLMEWLKEYKEPEPHHRHVSHLWALYPGNEITLNGTPDLANAARKTLEMRGDQGTGWSLAWKMNFWARLGDGERAYVLFRNLLKPITETGFNMSDGGGSYANLFCAHPPFQIDGNFGGTAGIAEMLIQSHEGFIHFLPSLPQAWKDGHFDGLRVRGDGEVSAKWENKKIIKASLKALHDNSFKIKVPTGITAYYTSYHPELLKIDRKHYINISLKENETIYFSTTSKSQK